MRELFTLPVTSESINIQLNRAIHMLRAGWVTSYGGVVIGIPHEQRAAYRELIASGQGKNAEEYRQNGHGTLTFCGMPVVSHDDVQDRIVVISAQASPKTSWPSRGDAQQPQVAARLTPSISPRPERADDPAPPPRKKGWETV